MNKRNLIIACVLALVAAIFVFSNLVFKNNKESKATDVTPADSGSYVEGVHFRTIENVADKAEKVQVQEFFWYGCPHCEAFEPEIKNYQQNMPVDVELVQIPVTWNQATSLHAAMFYLAESNSAPDALHEDLFKGIIALRGEGNFNLHIQEAERIFKTHGIELNDFNSQLVSSEIQSKVEASAQLMREMEISGTPTVAVDGTWVVLNNKDVSELGMFTVIDHLIAKARAARQ